jgi:hypothetical protein
VSSTVDSYRGVLFSLSQMNNTVDLHQAGI